MTTTVSIGNSESLPAWSMCRWVCRMNPTSDSCSAVLGELLVHALIAVVEALHPEVAHDLGVAEAGVDDDRGLTAEDQEPEHRDLERHAAVVAEDKEARFELDVPQVENLDLQPHLSLLWVGLSLAAILPRAARPRDEDSTHAVRRPRTVPRHLAARAARGRLARIGSARDRRDARVHAARRQGPRVPAAVRARGARDPARDPRPHGRLLHDRGRGRR